jgi:hypothetical protein
LSTRTKATTAKRDPSRVRRALRKFSVEVSGSGLVGIAISPLSMRRMKSGVTVESTIPQLLAGQLGGWYESGFSDLDSVLVGDYAIKASKIRSSTFIEDYTTPKRNFLLALSYEKWVGYRCDVRAHDKSDIKVQLDSQVRLRLPNGDHYELWQPRLLKPKGFELEFQGDAGRAWEELFYITTSGQVLRITQKGNRSGETILVLED